MVDVRVLSGFNPTLVRLRHVIDVRPYPATLGFNPTLVRLRRGIPAEKAVEVAEFQSHAGSIEANSHRGISMWIQFRFNPTLVRLRRVRPTRGGWANLEVSIPRWFD